MEQISEIAGISDGVAAVTMVAEEDGTAAVTMVAEEDGTAAATTVAEEEGTAVATMAAEEEETATVTTAAEEEETAAATMAAEGEETATVTMAVEGEETAAVTMAAEEEETVIGMMDVGAIVIMAVSRFANGFVTGSAGMIKDAIRDRRTPVPFPGADENERPVDAEKSGCPAGADKPRRPALIGFSSSS